MSSTLTVVEAAQRAIDTAQRHGTAPNHYWLALGGTSAWPNESVPPLPSTTWQHVPEAFLYLPIQVCQVVFPHPEGDFITPTSRYQPLNTVDPYIAALAGGTYVYFEVRIPPGLVTQPFRVYGLFQSIVPAPGAPATGPLLANQVSQTGILHWVETFRPVTPPASTSLLVPIVRQFL